LILGRRSDCSYQTSTPSGFLFGHDSWRGKKFSRHEVPPTTSYCKSHFSRAWLKQLFWMVHLACRGTRGVIRKRCRPSLWVTWLQDFRDGKERRVRTASFLQMYGLLSHCHEACNRRILIHGLIFFRKENVAYPGICGFMIMRRWNESRTKVALWAILSSNKTRVGIEIRSFLLAFTSNERAMQYALTLRGPIRFSYDVDTLYEAFG
jgi:hypothetical protein